MYMCIHICICYIYINAYLYTHTYVKLFESQQTGKFLEMEIPDHLTCLLRNLHAGQEATVRTRHGTTDWFKIGKGVRQGCILSPYLNARLDESQAGIKIAGRNTNNLRSADNTIMAESEEELKNLLIRVKEGSEKSGLKFNIETTKIMASSPITSWQTDGGKSGNSDRFYFLGLQNHCEW